MRKIMGGCSFDLSLVLTKYDRSVDVAVKHSIAIDAVGLGLDARADQN